MKTTTAIALFVLTDIVILQLNAVTDDLYRDSSLVVSGVANTGEHLRLQIIPDSIAI
jgi:hypothetical protein